MFIHYGKIIYYPLSSPNSTNDDYALMTNYSAMVWQYDTMWHEDNWKKKLQNTHDL